MIWLMGILSSTTRVQLFTSLPKDGETSAEFETDSRFPRWRPLFWWEVKPSNVGSLSTVPQGAFYSQEQIAAIKLRLCDVLLTRKACGIELLKTRNCLLLIVIQPDDICVVRTLPGMFPHTTCHHLTRLEHQCETSRLWRATWIKNNSEKLIDWQEIKIIALGWIYWQMVCKTTGFWELT